jgi:hypothetical protein
MTIELHDRANALIDIYGGLRPAARVLKMEHTYLLRLATRQKKNPSALTLSKLGIKKVVMYIIADERIADDKEVISRMASEMKELREKKSAVHISLEVAQQEISANRLYISNVTNENLKVREENDAFARMLKQADCPLGCTNGSFAKMTTDGWDEAPCGFCCERTILLGLDDER